MAAVCFLELKMTERLACTCRMPLSWEVTHLDPETRATIMRQAATLLTALNQIESMHDQETGSPENRRLDRIEAKLDLTLLLLGRTLEINTESAPRNVLLTPNSAEWQETTPPPEGSSLLIEFRPSESLPLNLKIPATGLKPEADKAIVIFDRLTETLEEALYQFVFRRHRQAIRAKSV
jgi:hypothetical protein